jgi:hypothetical protein
MSNSNVVSKLLQVVALPTYIRDVFGSNLGEEVDYFEDFVVSVSQYLRQGYCCFIPHFFYNHFVLIILPLDDA